jgi:exodeoxyribonuclease V gamma subunit
MRIVESNRLEVLADDLLGHWPKPANGDLSAVSIVVPSLGIGRWLTFRIASAFSVCAQVEFVYPATYVWSLFAAILPELSDQSPFDPATLTWRIYRLFGRIRPSTDVEPLSAYLSHAEPRDRLALARRVASLYAEVLAMRPEWAPNWQRGRLNKAEPPEHERWLASLWRETCIPATRCSPDSSKMPMPHAFCRRASRSLGYRTWRLFTRACFSRSPITPRSRPT